MKMPQDASTKIKILMKIHKTAALNSLSERPHKIGLIQGPEIRFNQEYEVPLLIPFLPLKPMSFAF